MDNRPTCNGSFERRLITDIQAMLRDGVPPENVLRPVLERLTGRAQHLERATKKRLMEQRTPRVLDMPVSVIDRITNIVTRAGRRYGVPPVALTGMARSRLIALPRHIAMWASRRVIPDAALMDIGAVFYRDHSTVLHAIRRVEEMRDADKAFMAETDDFLAEAGNGTTA